MKLLKIIWVLFILNTSYLFGQETITFQRVSIFTDGNAFVEKSMRVTPENGAFILKHNLVPKARLGTLSLSSKDGSIKSIKSFVDTIHTPVLLKNK